MNKIVDPSVFHGLLLHRSGMTKQAIRMLYAPTCKTWEEFIELYYVNNVIVPEFNFKMQEFVQSVLFAPATNRHVKSAVAYAIYYLKRGGTKGKHYYTHLNAEQRAGLKAVTTEELHAIFENASNPDWAVPDHIMKHFP